MDGDAAGRKLGGRGGNASGGSDRALMEGWEEEEEEAGL